MSKGRAPTLPILFVLALLAGCSEPPIRIVDVSVAPDGQDLAGPYVFAAVVQGGRGPLQVSFRVTVGEPAQPAELLGPGCGPAFPPSPGRGMVPSADAALPVDAATLADGGAAPFDGGLASDGGPNSDADTRSTGLVERCVAVPLHPVGGGRYEGRWEGPPFLDGTVLYAGVRVDDAAGETALWPPPGMSWLSWRLGTRRGPEISAIAPTAGAATGGTTVLIRGQGFGADAQVYFGGQLASVALVSPHLLEAVTPPGRPGAVDVVVDRAGARAVLVDAFAYQPAPEIIRVDPVEGPTEEVTTVVLEGKGFHPQAVVQAGGVALVTAWVTPERLSAEVPPGPAGAVGLVVGHPDGQASGAALFTRWPAPSLAAVEPAQGPDLGGTVVTLRGEDLRSPGAVWFGGRMGRVLDLVGRPEGHVARVETPIAPEGAVDVRWYNPDGQGAVLLGGYEYLGPPVVEDASPGITSRCGGGIVHLQGRNFREPLQVTFNGREAEVLSVSDDGATVTVRAPPGARGPVRVRVVGADGREARNNEVLVYGVQPAIATVEPSEAPIWGGTWITIQGADFSGDVEVRFQGTLAEQWRVNPSPDGCGATILAVAPAQAEGPADVTVRNTVDGGEATARAAVDYVAPRLTPDHGLVPGFANVTLEGVDLRAGLTVRLAGARVPLSERVDDRRWRIRTGPGPHGPVSLEVRNADGRGAVLEGAFQFRRFEDGSVASGLQPVGDCNDVSVADVDGDGWLDLATANGALGGLGVIDQPIGLHRGRGEGRFESSQIRPAGNGMNARLGDMDGDRDLDLLVSNLSGQSRLFRNEGGRFLDVPGFPGRSAAYDADFLDAEGDGDLDIFVLRTGDPDDNLAQGPDQLWLNDGRGNFREAPGAVAFDLADVHDHDVGVGDLDGDGLSDLVVVVDNISAQFGGASNRLLLNRGGRFEEVESPFDRYPGDWLHAELVDLDADGDLDVLLPQDYIEGFSRPGTPAMAVFLNVDGRGRFVEAPERVVGLPRLPAFEVVAADLDGDGDQDLLVAVYGLLFGDGSIEPFESVPLLNDGDGTYHQASAAFERPASIATADFGPGDFDGDGDTDLFECAARGESRVWIQR